MELNSKMRRRDRIKENKRRLSIKRASRLIIILMCTLITCVGCSGGGGGVLGVQPQIDKVLEDGWQELRTGKNDTAIMRFAEVIHGAPDDWEENSAFTGLGWAYANVNDVERAISYFEKVANKSNDANVGYAAVLLNRGNNGDYANALKLLKNIHMDNPDQTFNSENRLDVADADVHALTAIAFYYNGYKDDAVIQIRKAKDLDRTGANDRVNKIYNALLVDLDLESQ